MTRHSFLGLSWLFVCCGLVCAADEPSAASDVAADAQTYLLRYKFEPGEMVRWKVVHQALVRSTVSGTTQTAETRSESVKVWQVKDVSPDGDQATFVHSVDSVDMRQSVSGRQDVHYNSRTDAVVPTEFEEVAKAVGVPLSVILLDNRGRVLKRQEERSQPHAQPGEMTIPLPEKAVAVKETWSLPHDANVRQKDGSNKQVKTRQEFTLMEVNNGIATIRVETIVLTPVRDPALEAQLIQHMTDGSVRFDIEAGRVIGQQVDIDKHVIGFQGEASSMHYVTRFTEELLGAGSTASTTVAVKPDAKPAEEPQEKPAPAGEAAAAAVAGAEAKAAEGETKKPDAPVAKKATATKTPAATQAPAARKNQTTKTKPAVKPAPKQAATTKPKTAPKATTGNRPAPPTPQKRR